MPEEEIFAGESLLLKLSTLVQSMYACCLVFYVKLNYEDDRHTKKKGLGKSVMEDNVDKVCLICIYLVLAGGLL